MNNLHPLHVLVTRPSPAGEELCRLIEQNGGEATHFPTIAFAPPKDTTAFQQAIAALSSMDWLIFISPQAVSASLPAIRRAWPHFPPRVKLAAVGSKTAKAIQEAGLPKAVYPKEDWRSEGLLGLAEFQSISGTNIAIVRGEGGRDYLEKSLLSRGAQVSHLIAYQRVLPKEAVGHYVDLFKRRQIDVVVCTSFEGVSHFKQLLGNEAGSLIKEVPLVVVSERIKTLAHDLGFQTIWVAREVSQEAILELLLERRNELCQMKQKRNG